MRLPFFYGWIIVAVTFVTMAIGVTARTSFSLLFPPIIGEFGWERGGHGGSLFVWLSGFGCAEPADRTDDGSPRSSCRHGAWRHPDGRRLAAGAADDATMASLPDDWRAGRRRKRLPRLLRVNRCFCLTGSCAGAGSRWAFAFAGVGIGSIILLPWVQT